MISDLGGQSNRTGVAGTVVEPNHDVEVGDSASYLKTLFLVVGITILGLIDLLAVDDDANDFGSIMLCAIMFVVGYSGAVLNRRNIDSV